MTTPNELKTEFTKLFEQQKEIENDPRFKSLKDRHKDIK